MHLAAIRRSQAGPSRPRGARLTFEPPPLLEPSARGIVGRGQGAGGQGGEDDLARRERFSGLHGGFQSGRRPDNSVESLTTVARPCAMTMARCGEGGGDGEGGEEAEAGR